MTDMKDARIAQLETLLARNLVLDYGSAEDGADAIGGFHRVIELVDAHKAANPRDDCLDEEDLF